MWCPTTRSAARKRRPVRPSSLRVTSVGPHVRDDALPPGARAGLRGPRRAFVSTCVDQRGKGRVVLAQDDLRRVQAHVLVRLAALHHDCEHPLALISKSSLIERDIDLIAPMRG